MNPAGQKGLWAGAVIGSLAFHGAVALAVAAIPAPQPRETIETRIEFQSMGSTLAAPQAATELSAAPQQTAALSAVSDSDTATTLDDAATQSPVPDQAAEAEAIVPEAVEATADQAETLEGSDASEEARPATDSAALVPTQEEQEVVTGSEATAQAETVETTETPAVAAEAEAVPAAPKPPPLPAAEEALAAGVADELPAVAPVDQSEAAASVDPPAELTGVSDEPPLTVALADPEPREPEQVAPAAVAPQAETGAEATAIAPAATPAESVETEQVAAAPPAAERAEAAQAGAEIAAVAAVEAPDAVTTVVPSTTAVPAAGGTSTGEAAPVTDRAGPTEVPLGTGAGSTVVAPAAEAEAVAAAPVDSGDLPAAPGVPAQDLVPSAPEEVVNDEGAEQQVAALPGARPEPRGTPVPIGEFLRAYGASSCLLALPDGDGAVEAYAEATADARALTDSYRRVAGLDLGLTARTVTAAQCSTLAFSRSLAQYPDFPLSIALERRQIASGERLSGTVSGMRKNRLYLLVIDDEGMASLVEAFSGVTRLKQDFSAPMTLTTGPVHSSQLLIAIATDVPLRSVEKAQRDEADIFFAALAEEIRTSNTSVHFGLSAFEVE